MKTPRGVKRARNPFYEKEKGKSKKKSNDNSFSVSGALRLSRSEMQQGLCILGFLLAVCFWIGMDIIYIYIAVIPIDMSGTSINQLHTDRWKVMLESVGEM